MKDPPRDPVPRIEQYRGGYAPGGAVFRLAYDNDLSIGAVCFHQTMGVRNAFKWEDLYRPSLISPISHSINDLLHGNSGVRKVLRSKQQARKGIQIDSERHLCQPIEWDRLTVIIAHKEELTPFWDRSYES